MDTETPATTKQAFQKPLTKLIHIALFAVAFLALALIDPAVLCLLWNWFAVREGFHGLTYGYAFGLYLLLRFIVSPSPPLTIPRERERKKGWPDNPRDLWMPLASAYFGRLYTVSSGAVLHLLLSHG